MINSHNHSSAIRFGIGAFIGSACYQLIRHGFMDINLLRATIVGIVFYVVFAIYFKIKDNNSSQEQ